MFQDVQAVVDNNQSRQLEGFIKERTPSAAPAKDTEQQGGGGEEEGERTTTGEGGGGEGTSVTEYHGTEKQEKESDQESREVSPVNSEPSLGPPSPRSVSQSVVLCQISSVFLSLGKNKLLSFFDHVYCVSLDLSIYVLSFLIRVVCNGWNGY